MASAWALGGSAETVLEAGEVCAVTLPAATDDAAATPTPFKKFRRFAIIYSPTRITLILN
jgi:hypothetical protein